MSSNLNLVLTNKYWDAIKRADANGLQQIEFAYLEVSDVGGVAKPTDTKIDGTKYRIKIDSARYQGESIISLTGLDSEDSRAYTVRSLGAFSAAGELLAVCKVQNPASIAVKTSSADLYLSVDVLIKSGDPTKFKVQGVPWHPALATHTSEGVLRIATVAEARAEKINNAAITPAVFKPVHDQIKKELKAEVTKIQKLFDTYKSALCQAGHIQLWTSKAAPPPHWFACDGKAFPAKYKDLLRLYPNGKTPNFDGRYPRHTNNPALSGNLLAQSYQKHTHGGTANAGGAKRVWTENKNLGRKWTNTVAGQKASGKTSAAGNHKHDSGVYIRWDWEGTSPFGNNIRGYPRRGHQSAAHHEGEGRATPWTSTTGNHTHSVNFTLPSHNHYVDLGAHNHYVDLPNHTHSLAISYSGATETRPNSFYGRFIIFGGIPH